jgi:hypothetical protein
MEPLNPSGHFIPNGLGYLENPSLDLTFQLMVCHLRLSTPKRSSYEDDSYCLGMVTVWRNGQKWNVTEEGNN